jgi:hypothetical protein
MRATQRWTAFWQSWPSVHPVGSMVYPRRLVVAGTSALDLLAKYL